jgi:hypothetical protein
MGTKDNQYRIQLDSTCSIRNPYHKCSSAERQQLLRLTKPTALTTCENDNPTLIDMVLGFQLMFPF